ncbi:hypothetical protein CBP31_00420 [Oceanisphaera profunda]|uniref:Uncharacterized protein n=1 Tax=Oceanisphaera profunda TaxID=1416627 RepID=A0A1Y0D187_9GAMM|nr:hypothetical protein CBP31_00420 [Oceanisphaera profunda]
MLFLKQSSCAGPANKCHLVLGFCRQQFIRCGFVLGLDLKLSSYAVPPKSSLSKRRAATRETAGYKCHLVWGFVGGNLFATVLGFFKTILLRRTREQVAGYKDYVFCRAQFIRHGFVFENGRLQGQTWRATRENSRLQKKAHRNYVAVGLLLGAWRSALGA